MRTRPWTFEPVTFKSDEWGEWIALIPKRIDWCMERGKERTDSNLGVAHRNNLPKSYDRDVERDRKAVMVEAVGMLYFSPCDWYVFGKERGRPDIDGFIDMKGVEELKRRLVVPVGQLKLERAYCLCYHGLHPLYCLRGWNWGHVIEKLGTIEEQQPGRPAHYLGNEHLLSMPQLLKEQKRRKALVA